MCDICAGISCCFYHHCTVGMVLVWLLYPTIILLEVHWDSAWRAGEEVCGLPPVPTARESIGAGEELREYLLEGRWGICGKWVCSCKWCSRT